MRLLVASICCFLCLNLGMAQNNSLNGTFFNNQIGLQIILKGTNGIFTGQYKVQSQAYAITAQLQNNIIVGNYPYNGVMVPIQIMDINGNYILITEGVTIPLTFQALAENKVVGNFEETNPQTGNNSIKVNIPAGTTTSKKATGKSFGDPYSGFKFNIPQDWIGKQMQDGSYLIGHNSKAGFILVMPHNHTSLDAIYQESIQGIQDETTQLMPTDGISKYGTSGLIAQFSGMMEGQPVKADAISLLSPNGGGLNIMIAVRSDLYTQEYPQLAQTIANSVIFSKPKTSPAGQQWTARLKGKRLLYMKTANGFSDKITIDLCSTGQFGYNSNSSGMSGGVDVLTYASQGGGQGTWKIIGKGQNAVLILSFHNGEVYEYELSNRDSSGQINLSNRRYFIQDGGC